jgi:acyl-CoA synthetase (NDP forming)
MKRLLGEDEGYALLSRVGVPVPQHRRVTSSLEAEDAAEAIGFPVVLKVVSAEVVHKTDAGGVVMNLSDRAAVGAAYQQISTQVAAAIPGAVIEGFLVEEQVRPGLELFIGGRTDPSFGKVITFGLGGVLVELIHDVTIRVLPVDRDDVSSMIRGIKGYPLIRGFRSSPPLDEVLLVDLILAITTWFGSEPTITEFDINPLRLYQDRAVAVDARFYEDHEGIYPACSEHALVDPSFFLPSAIAVVGATADPAKIGYAVLRNLLSFPGQLYPVNPHYPEILGRKAYPSLLAIPGPVGMVVVTVPATAVPGVIREAAKKQVRIAVIISAGFRETGEAGRVLEEEVIALAAANSIRVVGPNSLGIMLPGARINTTFDPVTPKGGYLAFISQSGAVITMIVDWSLPVGIGFSLVASVGNQADLGFQDYLKLAEQDPATKAVILYIEELRDGCGFLKVARRITVTKPVIAVKAGSSAIGRTSASSHTGSLAGDDPVYRAALTQAGVVMARSLTEAFLAGRLLVSEGYPAGRRTIVITSAGGFAVLASDYAAINGIDLVSLPEEILTALNQFLPDKWNHQNPMDIVGDASTDRFARVFDLLIERRDLWDIAVVIAVPTAVVDLADLAREVVKFSKGTDRMVVGCLLGGDSVAAGVQILRDHRVENFTDLEVAFRVVGAILASR